MKIKKHIYSIDPDIDHERKECDDGTYRDYYTVHILRDGSLFTSVYKDNLEVAKTQARVNMEGWNAGISNLTFWGWLRYVFTGEM